MTTHDSTEPAAEPAGSEADGAFEVRFADRSCPRCRSRFVASYYQEGSYVKSRCLDCMLFWPTPMMA
jgi:hypothetical protein